MTDAEKLARAVKFFKGLASAQRTAIEAVLSPEQKKKLADIETNASVTFKDAKDFVVSLKPLATKIMLAAKLTKEQMTEILEIIKHLGI